MKSRNLTITRTITAIIIALIILTGCRQQQTNIDPDIAIPVNVEEIKLKSIEQYINTTGTVSSTKEVLLKSEMSGKYKLLNNPRTGRPFALGDIVNAGQEIIAFEDEEYINNIALESKKLNLDIAKQEFENQKPIFELGGITQKDYTNSESTYINAKYSYENALLQLAKMKIIAPFKAVIVELPYYTSGNKTDNGAEMLKLMDYSKLYMEVNMPEKDINTIKVNQNVRILNYTLPNDTIMGKITQLSPVVNPDTRTFLGSIVIDNPSLLLRPGMFVKAEIITAKKDGIIVMDKEIVLSRQRGKFVYVVEQGTAIERRVTFGLENPEEVEITNGLNVDDRLVTEGFETLKNRSKVSIIR